MKREWEDKVDSSPTIYIEDWNEDDCPTIYIEDESDTTLIYTKEGKNNGIKRKV
jgi:hypothetical protein